MEPRRLLSIAAIFLVLGACAPRLIPAPTAALVEGRGKGAAAEAAGVRIVARARAWNARPLDLDAVITPILVTIDNGSDAPLRIRYNDFALVRPDGRSLVALAPYDVEGVLWERAAEYPFARFHHHPFLFHRFHFDPFFDDFRLLSWVPIRLPTADMVQMVLPERPLAPHERVSGFLYFERLRRDLGQLDFTARLVDNRTGEERASVRIPFVVE